MRVALINASPKTKGSASAIVLEDLKKCLSRKVEIIETSLHRTFVTETGVALLNYSDAWVLSCPLYVDSVPAHLLSCMIQLEKEKWTDRKKRVYGLINCGFHEGVQADCALDVLKNWCARAGFVWGGGIGIGGGSLSNWADKPIIGQSLLKPIHKTLEGLAADIAEKKTRINQYTTVAFPRFMYKISAQTQWRQMIRANGGKAKDLGNIPG